MNLNVILERDLGYLHVQGPLLPAGRLEKVRLPTTEDDICNKDRDGIPRRNTSTLLPDLWVHPTPIPSYDLCFPPYAFTLLEYRKRSYWDNDEEDYLMVVIRSRLILRGWIHLSRHYG